MKIQVNKQNVGLRIKQIRQNKGYTLEAFGKLFDGATKGNVQQWEQGRSLPNKERIKAIAKFSDMTVNELLYGSVEEFVRENFYNIDNYYNDLPKDDKEFLFQRNDINRNNYVEWTVNSAKEKNITVNDLDQLLQLADNIINISSKVEDIAYNFLLTLIKKLDIEELLDLLTLLREQLEGYSLNETEKKMLESIELYVVEGIINDDLTPKELL